MSPLRGSGSSCGAKMKAVPINVSRSLVRPSNPPAILLVDPTSTSVAGQPNC